MKAKFTFLSGARAGQTSIFSQAHIGIGRHPQCELQFDPDKDLDVSSRHAQVTLNGTLYVLRDLGSTNGTFVNGKRLTGEHVLATKDVIRFGIKGPELEFGAITEGRQSPVPATSAPAGTVVFGMAEAPPAPTPPALTPQQMKEPRRTPGPGTQTRVKLAVRKETKGLRRTAFILFGLVLVLSGAYLWQARSSSQQLAAQKALLLRQADSLAATIEALSAGGSTMQIELDSVRKAAAALQVQLAAGPTDAGEIAELRKRLDAAIRQQRNLSGAATLDATRIASENRDAIALVFVEFADKSVFTGTAFAVQSDPTGGLLVTNKHVVVDSTNGEIASRIGVVFNGSAQNFRADVVRVHPDADLAVLRVSVHRGFPTVKGLGAESRTGGMGEPVGILGFPQGLDLVHGRDWSKVGAAATLSLGTVSRVLPDLLQLDSYGAQGSSGSPVFDRKGEVLGVIYGGQKGSNGRILYAVPVRFVHEVMTGN
jgi:S1-C subfamily serine protease